MSKAGFGVYQQKPVKVEAWKFNQYDEAALSGLHKWVEDAGAGIYHWSKLPVQGGGFGLEVVNADGERILVKSGEYIIKGNDGRFYACEEAYFTLNYEEA